MQIVKRVLYGMLTMYIASIMCILLGYMFKFIYDNYGENGQIFLGVSFIGALGGLMSGPVPKGRECKR